MPHTVLNMNAISKQNAAMDISRENPFNYCMLNSSCNSQSHTFTTAVPYYDVINQLQTEYLTLEHNIGLELEHELILNGQYVINTGQTDVVNYTVAPLKTQRDYARQAQTKIQVEDVEHGNYMATIQFARPFDYR